MKEYFIHDNGGRPFKVHINKNINVYKYLDIDDYSKKPVLFIKDFINFFIGKSPLNSITESSGGFGKDFDGNTILVHTKEDEYIYIGESIFKFYSFSPIIDYVSPVGNNDVPYPYAIDKEGNYYLMIEDIVINKTIDGDDPYDYYYNMDIKPDNIKGKKIKYFMIGEEIYNFSYYSRPHKDYDRISRWDNFGDGMKYILEDNKEYKIDRKEYINIMKKIGKDKGLRYLKGYKLLHKRL